MEAYAYVTPREPFNTEVVSRVDISHEGTWLRAVTTIDVRVVGTFDRVDAVGSSNDTGNWICPWFVANVNLSINNNLTDVSVGRNGSCCEKWDDK